MNGAVVWRALGLASPVLSAVTALTFLVFPSTGTLLLSLATLVGALLTSAAVGLSALVRCRWAWIGWLAVGWCLAIGLHSTLRGPTRTFAFELRRGELERELDRLAALDPPPLGYLDREPYAVIRHRDGATSFLYGGSFPVRHAGYVHLPSGNDPVGAADAFWRFCRPLDRRWWDCSD